MKYAQVPELRRGNCDGCAHESTKFAKLSGCDIQLGGRSAYTVCAEHIWIADTDEARLEYITRRLTNGATS